MLALSPAAAGGNTCPRNTSSNSWGSPVCPLSCPGGFGSLLPCWKSPKGSASAQVFSSAVQAEGEEQREPLCLGTLPAISYTTLSPSPRTQPTGWLLSPLRGGIHLQRTHSPALCRALPASPGIAGQSEGTVGTRRRRRALPPGCACRGGAGVGAGCSEPPQPVGADGARSPTSFPAGAGVGALLRGCVCHCPMG